MWHDSYKDIPQCLTRQSWTFVGYTHTYVQPYPLLSYEYTIDYIALFALLQERTWLCTWSLIEQFSSHISVIFQHLGLDCWIHFSLQFVLEIMCSISQCMRISENHNSSGLHSQDKTTPFPEESFFVGLLVKGKGTFSCK